LTATQKLTVVQMRKPTKAEVWRALMGAVAFRPSMSKIVIAVDEDIDPENLDAVFWALGYRSQPHRDVQIIRGMDIGHAPRHDERGSADDSCLLWDATLKETFPPISLPKKEYMERARKLWERLELPKLEPESPWHGYSLGDWNAELDEEARLAASGDYWRTGEKIARERRRTSDTPLNTSTTAANGRSSCPLSTRVAPGNERSRVQARTRDSGRDTRDRGLWSIRRSSGPFTKIS
jgi:4-hydroxy-3-polyprenylbenzoate decarboxylase